MSTRSIAGNIHNLGLQIMTTKITTNASARTGAAVLLLLLGGLLFLFPFLARKGETAGSAVTLGLLVISFAYLFLWMVSNLRRAGTSLWRRPAVLVHCALWLILVGGLITYLTRNEAVLILTEGHTVNMKENPFLFVGRSGMLGGLERPFSLRFLKHNIQTAKKNPFLLTNVTSEVEVIEKGQVCRRETIRVNYPLRHRGVSFLLKDNDFSPRFVLHDSKTGVIFDSFVNLKSIGRRVPDYFQVPEMGITVRAKIYPDYYDKDGKPATRGLIPNNPAAYVELVRGKEVIYSGVIAEGSSAETGTLSISFDGLKWWTHLDVRSDPGVPVIYAGFILGLIGLVLCYIRPESLPWRRWLRGVVGERRALRSAGGCHVPS